MLGTMKEEASVDIHFDRHPLQLFLLAENLFLEALKSGRNVRIILNCISGNVIPIYQWGMQVVYMGMQWRGNCGVNVFVTLSTYQVSGEVREAWCVS